MATPEVQLSEKGPFMGRHQIAGQVGIMGEDELAIGTTPDVDLDRIGHGGRRHQTAERVVWESGRPSPVTDDC
jgi:hypothetical protein